MNVCDDVLRNGHAWCGTREPHTAWMFGGVIVCDGCCERLLGPRRAVAL